MNIVVVNNKVKYSSEDEDEAFDKAKQLFNEEVVSSQKLPKVKVYKEIGRIESIITTVKIVNP